MKQEFLQIRIDEELLNELRHKASVLDLPVSHVVRHAIRNELSRMKVGEVVDMTDRVTPATATPCGDTRPTTFNKAEEGLLATKERLFAEAREKALQPKTKAWI